MTSNKEQPRNESLNKACQKDLNSIYEKLKVNNSQVNSLENKYV